MQKINDWYYEKPYISSISFENTNAFYFMDYDEREATINMEFQHLHAFYEIMLFLSPKAIHYINGIPYEIKCGDFILLKPGLLHMSEYPAGKPSDRIIMQFALPYSAGAPQQYQELQEYYRVLLELFETSFPIYRFADPYRKQLVNAANDLYLYLHVPDCTQSGYGKFCFHHKFLHFLHTLYSLREHNLYSPQKVSDALTQKIYEINNYILSHYQENLTLEELAKRFYISPCYLSHQFKNINQFTLSGYIHMTRVRNAQFLLLSSSLSISEIAQQCGFQSFSQFNRIFRRYAECSPREYQKQHRFA